jgi:hypothetical protein
MGNFIEILISI